MTSSPAAPAAARPKKSWLRRWLRRFGWLVLTFALLVLGLVVCHRIIGARRLSAAIAEADRLDPGWQWEDLAAKRAAVPDDQNAAPVVLEAARLLPEDWPPKQAPESPRDEAKSLVDRVREVESVEQLDAALLTEVRDEVQKFGPALRAAHQLAGYRTGRYPDLSFEDYHLSRELNHLDRCRQVAKLLWLDAVLRAEERRAQAALASSRCLVIAGRSIGDEPGVIAQVSRNACRQLAVKGVERTLAQGQAAEDDLAAMQQLFQDEQAQNTLLMALRGERAFRNRVMSWVDDRDLEQLDQGSRGIGLGGISREHPWLNAACHWFMVGWLKENHAVMLELSTEAVEAAKLPVDDQVARLKPLHRKAQAMQYEIGWPPYRYAYGATSTWGMFRIAETFATSRAELRCAIAALAAERFRLAHGRWPNTLDELVPRSLAAVPLDPFDSKPVKLSRFDDGILIYSVGRYGDGRGAEDRSSAPPGVEIEQKLASWKSEAPGFRLWDVPHRRQPPRPRVPENEPDNDQMPGR
jgi:hypothetical protein